MSTPPTDRSRLGYDAVHCASAAQLDDDTVVAAAAGDQHLLQAWLLLGMETYEINQD